MHHRSPKSEMGVPKPALPENLRNWIVMICGGALVWFAWACCATSQTVVVNAEELPAAKAADTIDLASYEALLKQYSERIESAKNDPSEIARIGRTLPKSWNVQAGSTSVSVSTEELRRACEQGERVGEGKKEAAPAAEQRLRMMEKAAEDLEKAAKDSQSDRAKQELDKVFARTEFSSLNGPSWLQQWNARVGRWLEKQIEKVLRALNVPPTIGRIVFWPVIVISLLFLGYLVYRLLTGRAVAVPAMIEARSPPEKTHLWWAEALAAAERRDFREAVHCGYWAAITRLEERQLVAEEKTRTPREYLRMLDTHPVERGILREQTTRLERVWYGCREATAADWSSARLELEKMGCT